jgi:hypothetical protein
MMTTPPELRLALRKLQRGGAEELEILSEAMRVGERGDDDEDGAGMTLKQLGDDERAGRSGESRDTQAYVSLSEPLRQVHKRLPVLQHQDDLRYHDGERALRGGCAQRYRRSVAIRNPGGWLLLLLFAPGLVFAPVGRARAQTTTCSAATSTQLVGLWESRETSKGGLGHAMEFRADGSFVETFAILLNLFYRISGDHLALVEAPAAADTVLDMTFRIDGSVLTETGADGSTLTKERFGKPPAVAPTLAGVWRYRHDTGALAYERYADDGTFQFRLPMRSVTGCFTLAGDRLRLAPQAASQTVMTISWRAGDLVLPGRGKDAVYRREPAGAWYDLEHLDVKLPR